MDNIPPSNMLRPKRWKILFISSFNKPAICFCLFPSSIIFQFIPIFGRRCKITYFAPFKRTKGRMKKYYRILGYLKQKKGQLGLYFLCVVFATLFGVVSIGMLIPFFELIFNSGDGAADLLKNAPFGQQLTSMVV